MRTSKTVKFLGTFDPGDENPQPAAGAGNQGTPPTPPPAASVPEPTIPVSALSSILGATRESEEQARQRRDEATRVQQQQQQSTPRDPRTGQFQRRSQDENTEPDDTSLRDEMAAIRQELANARLETYRANAIGAARSAGNELIDGIVVYGPTTQAIDASISVAIAEYELIRQRVQKQIQDQVAAAIPQQQQQQALPAQPSVPQGTVGGVGGQPTAQPQTQEPQPQLNSPSFIRVPGLPDGQNELTQEQLQYLTTVGVRTGEYARYRHLIQAALRAQGNPGAGFTFQQQAHMAPPVPPPQAPISPYSGFSAPQVPPPVGGYARPAPTTQHPMQFQGGPPQAPGRAPQPADVDRGAPVDPNAVHSAAQASISSMRARSANMPSTH